MPPLITWLIRHGQSTTNAGLPAVQDADAPLTEHGLAQSRAFVEAIPSRPDRLIFSPYQRSRNSADFFRARWPDLAIEIWPIQEFTYLCPQRCQGTTQAERQPLIRSYWERADPHYRDGEKAESFADFLERLRNFHSRLKALPVHFVVMVGHGQFFRAYSLALQQEIPPSAEAMKYYRQAETANPLANGEMIRLSEKDLLQANL